MDPLLRQACTVLLPLLVAAACRAESAASQPAAVRPPEYTSTVRVSEDMLGARKRQVIILPSEPPDSAEDQMQQGPSGVIAKLPPGQHRLPEGYIVANREGRVETDNKWQMLHLVKSEGLPDAPPLRILPNPRLGMLEAILGQVDHPLAFTVTGRVTEFQGVNYILLEQLAEVSASRAAVPRTSLSIAKATGTTPAVGTDLAVGTRPAAREPTPEEVMQQLMQNRPLKSVVLPAQTTAPASQPASANQEPGDAAGGNKDSASWDTETLLVDRNGRVVPGESWWMFAFEDKGQQPKDKPIRLLPNQLLETALSLSGGGTRGTVFTVSGEVTPYKGVNYLLLRKVLVRRDMGNLR